MTPKRNRETYDRLCDIADRLLARHNPCAGCTGCDVRLFSRPYPYDCCHGCVHLGPNGCTIKSLACKLWICGKAEQRQAKTDRGWLLFHQLDRLIRIATQLNLHYARATPEQVLDLSVTDKRGMWYFYYEMKGAAQ